MSKLEKVIFSIIVVISIAFSFFAVWMDYGSTKDDFVDDNISTEIPDINESNAGLYDLETDEFVPWQMLLNDGVFVVDELGVLSTTDTAKETLVGKLIINDDVTSIADNAFVDCTGLQRVDTSNVATIGAYAFKGCTGLTAFDLADCVISIGDGAFQSCTELISFNINETSNLTSIGPIAFNNSAIKFLYVPKNVTTIYGAFAGMYDLVSISFAEDINVDFQNVVGAPGLVEIEMISTNGSVSVRSLNQTGVFLNCTSLASINMPNSVTNIAVNTFYNCKSLETVTLSSNLKIIYQYSFSNCSSLKTIVFTENITKIGTNSFRGCLSLENVYIPSNVITVEATCFYNCANLTIYCQEDMWTSTTPTWCAYDADGTSLPVKTGYTYDKYLLEVSD